MASSTPHTIFLDTADPSGFSGRVIEKWVADAASTIRPGDLLERDNATEVSEHSTAGGNNERFVAIENPFDDAYTTPAIDSVYAVGDTVRVVRAIPGDVAYMFLADSNNAAVGSPLVSAGTAGALALHTPQAVDEGGSATFTNYVDAIVGYADEALNNTSGSDSRIKVRIA